MLVLLRWGAINHQAQSQVSRKNGPGRSGKSGMARNGIPIVGGAIRGNIIRPYPLDGNVPFYRVENGVVLFMVLFVLYFWVVSCGLLKFKMNRDSLRAMLYRVGVFWL